MKILSFALLLMVSGTAFAGTDVPLQIPAAYTRPVYPAENVVTGFSADGNYLIVHARGWYASGHSGRGSNYTYQSWCGDLTFDLAGNLVGSTVVTASGTASYYACPTADASGNFTNSGGYNAYTVVTRPVYYWAPKYTPTLMSP